MKILKALQPLLAVLFVTASAAAQQVARIPVADRPLAGAPVQQFSIGAEDGADWELLSRVAQVAFDANENLYILDGGNSRVLVFDPRGKFVRKIGKKGGGPGELLSPVGLALTKDGYVAVTDMGRPGVSLFKRDGTFVKNLMMGDSLGFPTMLGGTAAHPTSGVVVRSNPMIARQIRNGADPLDPISGPRRSPVTWLKSDGSNRNLYSIELPNVTSKVSDTGAPGRRNMTYRVAMTGFSPPILWAMLPNGAVAIADEAGYRIKIVNNGKVERTIERAMEPRQATERDRERAREQRRKDMKTGTGMTIAVRAEGAGPPSSSISTGGAAAREIPAADIEAALKEMTFLQTIPVLRRMSIDSKGRLWVQRAGKQVGEDGPLDIIDAAGRYVGTVNDKLPDAVSPGGRAAYITKDDMDVEKVVVKKLPAGWM